MKRTLGRSVFAAFTCTVLFPLAAAHLSIGCVGRGDEAESAPEEKVAEAPQAITGTCTVDLFNAPCDPDGAGALTECEGVCRLDSSNQPVCLAITSIGGTAADLNGRLCGGATSTDCGNSGKTCNNGVCADPNATNQPVPNGVACQANAPGGKLGSLCSGQCNFGQCVAVAAVCPQGRVGPGANNCQYNTCNPINASFCIQVPLPQGTTCDDANGCTVAPDTCDAAGKCIGGAPKDCNDTNVCTNDTCDPATGTCGHAPNTAACDDGNLCTESDVCAAGMCTPGTPKNCDDGNACTMDGCDPATGCTHTAVSCDDGNPCTTDTCDPVMGCTHAPAADGTNCDTDGDSCNGTATCMAGACVAGMPAPCDDGNPCTTEMCVNMACQITPVADGTACGDADMCNGAEMCMAGACAAGTPLSCDDGDACTADACDATTGCTHTAVSCDDGDPCTVDACDAVMGCTHTPAADGTSCDDGDSCNGTATCMSGACVAGPPAPCDDGNPCTTESCVNGACQITNVADGTACADADQCNGAETCQSGACTAGTPLSCDDGDPCTTDSCDATNGCKHDAVPNCGTGGGGTGGSGTTSSSSSSSGSTSSSSGSTTTSSGAGGGMTSSSGGAQPGDTGGCGCRIDAEPPSSWAGLSMASLLALVAGLRRRRRDGAAR